MGQWTALFQNRLHFTQAGLPFLEEEFRIDLSPHSMAVSQADCQSLVSWPSSSSILTSWNEKYGLNIGLTEFDSLLFELRLEFGQGTTNVSNGLP